METNKENVKNLMHVSCSLLVILNIIMSVLSLFLPIFYSLDSIIVEMITITSLCYLAFSIIFLIVGILFPKKEKILTAKEKRNLFIFTILGTLIQGDLLNSLHGLDSIKKRKSIRRHWNAPFILISGILLLSMNLFTGLLVSGSETMNINDILCTLLTNPYGQILIAQFVD